MTLSSSSPMVAQTFQDHAAKLADKLAQVGAKLRQVRQDKGITLRQVYEHTLIPERHLEAIEEGNLEVLPEPVYVQSFVRKYAQYLGVNDVAEELPTVSHSIHSWSNSPSAKLGTLHLYLLYVLVVAGSVGALATAFSGNNHRWEELSVETTAQKQTKNEVSVVNLPPAVAVIGQPLNLSVVMLGESWVRVTVDGVVEYEGILAEGRNLTWSGRQQIKLRVGNGSAVSASFNNSPSAVVGAEGEVVEKTYDNKNSKQSFSPAQRPEDLWQSLLSRDNLGVVDSPN